MPQLASVYAIDAILLLVFCFLCIQVLRSSRKLSPPGPAGFPYIGHTYQIPRDRQWLQFDKWTRKYGEVIRITVMGEPTVILGSAQVANDLLDSRGSIYSDRPTAVMAGELVGWNRGLGYSPGPHNPRFREFRRLTHQFIGRRAAQSPAILSTQEKSATKLLVRILSDPSAFMIHVKQSSGALLLKLAYGYDVDENKKEDPLVKIAEEAMQGFCRASEPGAFLVDQIPALKYLPDWFPGAGFKRIAKCMRADLERLYDVPFYYVQSQMIQNRAVPSFISTYLGGKGTPTAEEEFLIKAAAASLYSAGVDSTPSSLASYILSMTLNPSIQTLAQAEIDSVLGSSYQRLPTFADRTKLPYINAIVLELLRWNPAVPLGLAHRLTQDDIYRGYFLPKGTVVWANIWTMLHDEKVFPDPTEFRPERFLDSSGQLRKLERHEDPGIISFGFGRRICPGMFLADNSIFIAIAMMLYVFDIRKAKDASGVEIEPEVEYDGFMCHPRPFNCSIKPRSKEAEALIVRAAASQ